MKKVLLAVAACLALANTAFAQVVSSDLRPTAAMTVTTWASAPVTLDFSQTTPLTVPIGATVVARWDAAPNETLHEVTRYEWREGTGTYQSTGVTVGQPSYAATVPSTFLTRGERSIQLRACNAIGCGQDAVATVIVTLPLPGIPRNFMLEQGPQASLTIPEAEQRVQAYALWAIDRHLTASEIGWLAVRWPSEQPLNKQTLLAYLDQQVSR